MIQALKVECRSTNVTKLWVETAADNLPRSGFDREGDEGFRVALSFMRYGYDRRVVRRDEEVRIETRGSANSVLSDRRRRVRTVLEYSSQGPDYVP